MKNRLIKIQFRDNNNTLDYIVVFYIELSPLTKNRIRVIL